jgi:hypothetical protein
MRLALSVLASLRAEHNHRPFVNSVRPAIIGENELPTHRNNRRSLRQSFISTGASAFFFMGAAVNSDHSWPGATAGLVSSGGSLLGRMDEVVSSDGSWSGVTANVVGSDGSLGTDAAVGLDGSVFGATGTNVTSVGRGRGNGISHGAGAEPSRYRLPSLPLARVNQLEMPCAMSDRGECASGRAGDGFCASTDVVASVTRIREYLMAFRTRTGAISFRRAPTKLSNEPLLGQCLGAGINSKE